MQPDYIDDFKVLPGKKIRLKDYNPGWIPKWAKYIEKKEGKKAVKEQAIALLESNRQKLIEMQELFWANNTYSFLIIFQGLDASGKDSAIKHVLSGVNPQGCQVTSFRTPSEEELNHDFIWRYTKFLPARGHIGIFNRSYFEDVLIVKVQPEVFSKLKLPQEDERKDFWTRRFEDINSFERHLVREGTIVVKFFLNMSKKTQKKRLLKRLENPDKYWKFSYTDIETREKWDEYIEAYEDVINNTSTKWAPWYIIPADKKWVTHSSISEIIVSQIKKLDLKYPVLDKEQKITFKKAKAELEKKLTLN